LVLERSQRGVFEVPPGMTLEWERLGGGAWETPEQLRRLVALVRERGPVPWVSERADELAARTGMSTAEAALLLAGLPVDMGLGQDLARSPVRAALGLRTADAAAARERLSGVPARLRIELVAAAMPDDPADLWRPHLSGDPDGPAARIAAVWLAAFGRRPDELDDSEARASLRLMRPRGRMLAGFIDPDGDPTLNADAAWLVSPQGQLLAGPGAPAEPFGGWTLGDVSLLLPWLFAARPVGDRARSGVPEVLRRVRARLANPDLLVSAGWAQGDGGGRTLLEVVQAPPYRPARGAEVPGSRDTGGFVLVGARSESVLVYGRPARLPAESDAGLLPLLGDAAALLNERVRFLRGEGADELVARILDTPVPEGGWEANPAVSAPALLAEVAAARGLSPDAAALYLQLLAGHDPSVRRIRDWNGWTGADFGRAAAELTEAGLAVRARRARAGRDVFLPGPWEDLKAPDQPVEAWRVRLYGGRPLGRLLALRPLHRLFEDAWREVEAGRGPAFEEVSR
jgi:hypothetical protein